MKPTESQKRLSQKIRQHKTRTQFWERAMYWVKLEPHPLTGWAFILHELGYDRQRMV